MFLTIHALTVNMNQNVPIAYCLCGGSIYTTGLIRNFEQKWMFWFRWVNCRLIRLLISRMHFLLFQVLSTVQQTRVTVCEENSTETQFNPQEI